MLTKQNGILITIKIIIKFKCGIQSCARRKGFIYSSRWDMYIYTANVGSGLQGFQGKAQGWGGKQTHTLLHLARDTKHTQSKIHAVPHSHSCSSREDRRGSKKVDVSTMIHRGPTLHQGLKYCLKQLAEMSSRWVVPERGVQDGPNTQTAPWRKMWVQQTMTVWPNEHAQYNFSFWLLQSPM